MPSACRVGAVLVPRKGEMTVVARPQRIFTKSSPCRHRRRSHPSAGGARLLGHAEPERRDPLGSALTASLPPQQTWEASGRAARQAVRLGGDVHRRKGCPHGEAPRIADAHPAGGFRSDRPRAAVRHTNGTSLGATCYRNLTCERWTSWLLGPNYHGHRRRCFAGFLPLPWWSSLRQPVTKVRSRYAQNLSASAGSLR